MARENLYLNMVAAGSLYQSILYQQEKEPSPTLVVGQIAQPDPRLLTTCHAAPACSEIKSLRDETYGTTLLICGHSSCFRRTCCDFVICGLQQASHHMCISASIFTF